VGMSVGALVVGLAVGMSVGALVVGLAVGMSVGALVVGLAVVGIFVGGGVGEDPPGAHSPRIQTKEFDCVSFPVEVVWPLVPLPSPVQIRLK